MRSLGWYQDPSLPIQYVVHTTNHRYLPTVLFLQFLPETCISPTCRVFGEQELYLIQLFFTKSPPPPPPLLAEEKTADLVRSSLRYLPINQDHPLLTTAAATTTTTTTTTQTKTNPLKPRAPTIKSMPPRHLAPSGAPVGQSGSSGNSGHISITSIRRRIAELIVYGKCHSPSLISSTSCSSLLSLSRPSKQTSKQTKTHQNALICENLFTY